MSPPNSPGPPWSQHPHNPYNWPAPKKWTTMLTACWITFIVGLNATSMTTAAGPISDEFGLGDGVFEYNFLAVTGWNAAAAIVPLGTLPLMDGYGVRIGYLVAYVLFTIFVVPQALAKNFATLVVCRVIGGALGGTLQNSADGIASNMFLSHGERVFPLTLYTFTLLFGVTMGPVLGAVMEPLGWRWVFWIELILYGACIPVVYFFMPESRGPILEAKFTDTDKATKPEAKAALHEFNETITRSAILLTTEPTITSFTIWSAFAYGLVFISTQSIPLVFTSTYGWKDSSTGLVQTSLGIGQIIALFACLLQNKIYIASAKHNPETPNTPVPESILHLSIPATILLSTGLFTYGWTTDPTQPQIHWLVPSLGLVLIGFASMVIVTAVSIYVTDSYPGYAASAIAAVAFGENIFAAVLPLAAKAMYVRLGFGWASSLLGFVGVVLVGAPVVLIFWGGRVRGRSRAIRRMGVNG